MKSLCLNPKFILALKCNYKGYEKYVLFWDTQYDEYCRGSVTPDISRLNRKTLGFLIKYGYIDNCLGDYVVKRPITFNIRLELPCKKCLECTRSRSREWSIRCELESKLYEHNYFVTLTYNDMNVPKNFYTYFPEDESLQPKKIPVMTLKKEHTFKFMKSLRQNYKRTYNHDNIRFFMCGEYGTKYGRPHYHYILFNLPIHDLELIGHSKNGFPLYRSRFIERSWKYGFVTVQKYSIETARYTAQYCCKKMNKRDSILLNKQEEFINMSRNKGIGSYWFFKNVDKIYNLKSDFVDTSIFHCNVKGNDYNLSKFSVPSAFVRYFKPITDSKRGLDTEHGSLRGTLNIYNEDIYDVILYKKMQDLIYSEEKIKINMQKYGYNYETDRYTKKYLKYLKNVSDDLNRKFVINRNLC